MRINSLPPLSFLGLKKISGFIVNHKSFRESLYGSLCALTNRDESDLEEMGLSDMVAVNTLVKQTYSLISLDIIYRISWQVMLAKHNGIFKDSIQTISKLMDSFANWSGTTTKLNTGTAVKLVRLTFAQNHRRLVVLVKSNFRCHLLCGGAITIPC